MSAKSENNVQTVEGVNEVSSANEGVLASLGIDGQLFAWQLFNFALVALIVWFMILKPLTKKMDERKKIIDESLNRAKEIEETYAKSKAEYDAAVRKARQEANAIVSEAKRAADELSISLKAKTKEDIDALVKQAKVKINEERDTVMEGVKAELAGLVATASEKILRAKLDDKNDQKLINDSLQSME